MGSDEKIVHVDVMEKAHDGEDESRGCCCCDGCCDFSCGSCCGTLFGWMFCGLFSGNNNDDTHTGHRASGPVPTPGSGSPGYKFNAPGPVYVYPVSSPSHGGRGSGPARGDGCKSKVDKSCGGKAEESGKLKGAAKPKNSRKGTSSAKSKTGAKPKRGVKAKSGGKAKKEAKPRAQGKPKSNGGKNRAAIVGGIATVATTGAIAGYVIDKDEDEPCEHGDPSYSEPDNETDGDETDQEDSYDENTSDGETDNEDTDDKQTEDGETDDD